MQTTRPQLDANNAQACTLEVQRTFAIRTATTPDDIAAVATLFGAYATWLNLDLSFQNFASELASLPGAYAPPRGTLLLARDIETNDPLGCVGLRPLPSPSTLEDEADAHNPDNEGDNTTLSGARSQPRPTGYAELKRLYVVPAGRGRGVGKALTQEAIRRAREDLEYDAIRMDSLPILTEALGLYWKMGFRRCEKYYDNPIEGVLFLELDLRIWPKDEKSWTSGEW